MLLLIFSHPLTPAQLAQLEALTGAGVDRVSAVPAQFDTRAGGASSSLWYTDNQTSDDQYVRKP